MDKLDYRKKYFKLASSLNSDFYLYFTTSQKNIIQIKNRKNETVGYYEDDGNYKNTYKMLKMLFDLKIVY